MDDTEWNRKVHECLRVSVTKLLINFNLFYKYFGYNYFSSLFKLDESKRNFLQFFVNEQLNCVYLEDVLTGFMRMLLQLFIITLLIIIKWGMIMNGKFDSTNWNLIHESIIHMKLLRLYFMTPKPHKKKITCTRFTIISQENVYPTYYCTELVNRIICFNYACKIFKGKFCGN